MIHWGIYINCAAPFSSCSSVTTLHGLLTSLFVDRKFSLSAGFAAQSHAAAAQGHSVRGSIGGGHQMHVVQHVYQQPVPTTTPAPTTKSPNQYLYEPHSCPKMDVATWENEVVIYDNKNCAM